MPKKKKPLNLRIGAMRPQVENDHEKMLQFLMDHYDNSASGTVRLLIKEKFNSLKK